MNRLISMYPETIPPCSRKRRILVMDDDRLIHKVARRMLNQLGFEVQCASNGSQALRIYESAQERGQKFDAVILDIEIPDGMGGEETMMKLKEMDSGSKVIVSSGDIENPMMVNYRKYGFMAVIPKPYGIRDLSLGLQKALNGHAVSCSSGSKIYANK